MSKFQLGQIVKQNRGLIAHYAVVVAENRTIGWVNNSTLEVKTIEGENWDAVKIIDKSFEFEEIKRNIKSFKDALEQGKARKYHLSEFNCEHWATLMVTGKSYIETVANSKEVKTALDGAMSAGGEALKHMGNVSNMIGSWWKNC